MMSINLSVYIYRYIGSLQVDFRVEAERHENQQNMQLPTKEQLPAQR